MRQGAQQDDQMNKVVEKVVEDLCTRYTVDYQVSKGGPWEEEEHPCCTQAKQCANLDENKGDCQSTCSVHVLSKTMSSSHGYAIKPSIFLPTACTAPASADYEQAVKKKHPKASAVRLGEYLETVKDLKVDFKTFSEPEIHVKCE